MNKSLLSVSLAVLTVSALAACNNTNDAQQSAGAPAATTKGPASAPGSPAAVPANYSRYTMAKQKILLDRQKAGGTLSAEDQKFLTDYPPVKDEGDKKPLPKK